jgi:hypothetical protein
MKTKWKPEEDQFLIENYPKMGMVDSAKALGRSETSVSQRAIKKLGLRRDKTFLGDQKAASWAKKSGLKLDFFKTWTREMAYVTGYAWADGSISSTSNGNRPNQFRLCCALEDEYFVHTIRNLLGSEHSINRVEGRVEKDGKIRNEISCIIGNHLLIEPLVELGCVRRKSYANTEFPLVPDQFLADFCRGYFDGDGSASGVAIAFHGSLKFMEGLKKALHEKLTLVDTVVSPMASIFKVAWASKRDNRTLFDWLYRDTDLFLARKKEKIQSRLLQWGI